MRLLEIRDDGEMYCTEHIFHNASRRYAILSHTWQKDQEVSHHDMELKLHQNKAGWDKLHFCARQATKDGIRYIWVDTCCIDRRDAREIQYAINSMFRWYKNAAKCYVYLADVSSFIEEDDWEIAFRRSRWFTRDWTLQELLAPSSVTFYSREGRYLGNRSELKTIICEITGIPLAALTGRPLHNFSVEERLSWSSRRKTEWPEDSIYSLCGIFGVHLAVIYGEGVAYASGRLRREIEDVSMARNRQRDLGYTWEGAPDNRLLIDDGLGPLYYLPVERCETPELFFAIFEIRFKKGELPGHLQASKGHYLLYEWDERNEVTRETWKRIIKYDRKIKVSFVLCTWHGHPSQKCIRCYKIRSDPSRKSTFKTCGSCQLSIQRVPPDYLPFEPIDTIIFDRDTYRNYHQERRKLQKTSSIRHEKQPELTYFRKYGSSYVPPIDLVGRRITMKWEPITNIVTRYLYCRCVLRLSTPSKYEEEMTVLDIAACPRHNVRGIKYRDYSELALPPHEDPYFQKFGGYNALWTMLLCCYPGLYAELNGLSTDTLVNEEQGLIDLQRLVAMESTAVIDMATNYRFEILDTLYPLGREDKSPRPPSAKNAIFLEEQRTKKGLNTKEKIDYAKRANRQWQLMRANLEQDPPILCETRELLRGEWNGIPHWDVEEL